MAGVDPFQTIDTRALPAQNSEPTGAAEAMGEPTGATHRLAADGKTGVRLGSSSCEFTPERQSTSARRGPLSEPNAVDELPADDSTLAPGSAPSFPSRASQYASDLPSFRQHPERYGRVKELGRGGWGVVDQVVDRHLEREVAIKRIGACENLGTGPLDADIRERFLHEAKITSQLQHPGVVPVHELGTGQNGEAYYVMKLLEGDTLRKQIRAQHAAAKSDGHHWTPHKLRTAIGPLLDRFIDVCNAVAYAHTQGVIHRDLKPSNVMVGGFGETIVVDWGLAKRLQLPPQSRFAAPVTSHVEPIDTAEPIRTMGNMESDLNDAVQQCEADLNAQRQAEPSRNAHSSGSHTSQGTVVGTPAYMSPEQAGGKIDTLSPASDIYALGVILYEIVAGEHPYRGLELLTIIEHIREGKWTPLRTAQPSAAKPLAAICRKAMALEPAARYATASDLAEDVRRFIAGDAVSVYDEPIFDRLARVCRRHQTACITGVAAALILLLSAIAFGVVIHDAHQSERAARVESQLAHRSALRSLIASRDSADAWLVDLSAALEFYPGLEPIRQELLNSAIAQYKRILSDLQSDRDQIAGSPLITQDDREVRFTSGIEYVKCYMRLGDLYRLTGERPLGTKHYQLASAAIDALEKEINDDRLPERLKDEVRLQRINASVGFQLFSDIRHLSPESFQSQDVSGASIRNFRDDRRWLLSVLPKIPDIHLTKFGDQHAFQAQAASSLARYHLANYRSQHNNKVRDGEDALAEAATWARWLAATRGAPRDHSLYEAIQRERAGLYAELGQTRQAYDVWRTLISSLNQTVTTSIARPDRLQSLAQAHIQLANCASALGQIEEADIAYREAIDVSTAAWQLLDVDSFHQLNLATAQHNLGRLILQGNDDSSEARAMLQRSVANYSRLLQKEATPDTLRRLSEAHESLAITVMDVNPKEAMEQLDQADLGYQLLADQKHLNDGDSLHWARVLQLRSRCANATGDTEQAHHDLQRCRTRLSSLDQDALGPSLQETFDAVQRSLNTL